jgi:hypothetical protein
MAVADPACRAPTLPVWRHAPGRARPVRRSGATSAGSAPAVGCGSGAEEDESRWGEGGGTAWGRDRSAAVPRAAHARHAGATSVGSAPLMGCRSGDGGGGETVWQRGHHWGRRRAGGGGGGLGFGRAYACACGVGILGGGRVVGGVFAKVSGLYM